MYIPHIIKTAESEEYFFEEGCYILEMSNSNNDPDLSIARARVKPSKETKLHKLSNTIERYIIIEGEGQVTLSTQTPEYVSKGDIVIIPQDCPQKIVNTGTEDLVFLVICTPRFSVDHYCDLTSLP